MESHSGSINSFSAAIIGAGFIADYHVKGIRAVPGAGVATLIGRDPARTRKRANELEVVQAGTDFKAVLHDDRIDGVVIATPDALHHDMTIRALEAGKPVLLQKPMALNLTECEDMLAAADHTGTRLTVSFMHRYFPEVRWLRNLLAEGNLGNVHTVRIRNATPGADWANWFFDSNMVSGGVAMQLGVHGIDLIGHLFGPIETVAGAAATVRGTRTLADGRRVTSTFEDNVLARYRLYNGGLVTHEMSYTEVGGCDRFRLEVYADKGTVWLRTERGRAALLAPDVTGTDDWIAPHLPEEPLGRAHHAHWIRVARGEEAPDDTGLAGASGIAVAEAIYAADRGGELAPATIRPAKGCRT